MANRQTQVTLWLRIDSTWRPSDTAQVYTDFGTGVVDTDKPLLARRAPVFPRDYQDVVAAGGYAMVAYGQGGYGGVAAGGNIGGYGRGLYGTTPYGTGYDYAKVNVQVEPAYGEWIFAAQIYDGAGNVQGALQEFTIFLSGEDPPPLSAFAYSSYNSGTDTVSFSVEV